MFLLWFKSALLLECKISGFLAYWQVTSGSAVFGLDILQSINGFKRRKWTLTAQLVLALISGLASSDLPSQCVYHILAKQYVFFWKRRMQVWCNMICRIIFTILSRLQPKNIIEGSRDNFHLYSNPVFLEFFIKRLSSVHRGCLVCKKSRSDLNFNWLWSKEKCVS